LFIISWYGDGAGNTGEENASILLPNPNALFAIGKGIWAVKLCCNKIFQLLVEGFV